MKPLYKVLLSGILVFASVISASAQWKEGPYFGLSLQGGVPINKHMSSTHSIGIGMMGKFGIPITEHNDYFTISMQAMGFSGKTTDDTNKDYVAKNLLSGFIGFRHDFREESYSYFFVEPQLGWTLIGTDYNGFSVLPTVGYSFNGKLDLTLGYQATFSQFGWAKLGFLCAGVSYNFYFAGSTE